MNRWHHIVLGSIGAASVIALGVGGANRADVEATPTVPASVTSISTSVDLVRGAVHLDPAPTSYQALQPADAMARAEESKLFFPDATPNKAIIARVTDIGYGPPRQHQPEAATNEVAQSEAAVAASQHPRPAPNVIPMIDHRLAYVFIYDDVPHHFSMTYGDIPARVTLIVDATTGEYLEAKVESE